LPAHRLDRNTHVHDGALIRIFGVLGALLLAAPVAAHQDTVAHSRMVMRADGTVEYALKIPVEDLAEAVGRQGHTALNAPEVRGAEDQLFRHFLPLVGLESGGRPCPVERNGIDVPEDERLYGELRFIFKCPAGAPVTVEYRVFFDVDPGHVGMLEVESPGGKARAELILERPRWEVNAVGPGPPQIRAIGGASAAGRAEGSPVVGGGSIVTEPARRAHEAESTAKLDSRWPARVEKAARGERPARGYWLATVVGVLVVAGAGVFYAARRRRSNSAG